MADDRLVGSRELLQLLINGGSGIDGLQIRLNAHFGPSLPDPTPVRVQPRYAYDPATGSIYEIKLPLDPSLVTLLTTSRPRIHFYKKDKHPSLPGQAWGRRYNFQWDVWAATPVLCDHLCDAVEVAATSMAVPLWEQMRIGLNIDEFQDAPYEIDSGIYRAFARGYCTVAVYAE